MDELLVVVLQAIFEFVVEVLTYGGLDWLPLPVSSRGTMSLSGRAFLWFVAGCVLAWLSVLVLNHTLIRLPVLRIANLVLAPIASAFLSQAIARRRSGKNPLIVPRDRFWQAFWFTLGLVTVRFAFAAHN